MTLTITPQEAEGLRKGLARLIKHKNQNIKRILKKMESDPFNQEANAIRKGMVQRRLNSIAEAEELLRQLNVINVVGGGRIVCRQAKFSTAIAGTICEIFQTIISTLQLQTLHIGIQKRTQEGSVSPEIYKQRLTLVSSWMLDYTLSFEG